MSKETFEQEKKSSLKGRIIMAIIMLVVALPCIFFGSYFFAALVLFLAGVASYELVHAMDKEAGWWVYLIEGLFVVLMTLWGVFRGNLEMASAFGFSLENYINVGFPLILIGGFLIVFFLLAVLDRKVDYAKAIHLFGGGLLVGFGFQCALYLRYLPISYNPGTDDYSFLWLKSALLLVVVLATPLLNDTFAYFGGLRFGKHKMAPVISPKKSWEGFAFGCSFSFVISFGLLMLFAGIKAPVHPLLDLSHWYYCLILALGLSVVGVLGDLSFSMIKRQFGIKDYGTIFRGHGGVLDRVDSPLFAAIFASLFIAIISSGTGVFFL